MNVYVVSIFLVYLQLVCILFCTYHLFKWGKKQKVINLHYIISCTFHKAIPYIFSYAASVGAKHFHCSAKLNKGIDELFLDLSKSEFWNLVLANAHVQV